MATTLLTWTPLPLPLSQVRDFNDDMDTGHFALAFEGLSWTDPDIFTLMLTQSLIGTFDAKKGGAQFSSAKLASELAKLDCGTQLMQPFCTCYNDTGLFGVYFSANMSKKENVDDLFGTIQEEVRRLFRIAADCLGPIEGDAPPQKAPPERRPSAA